MNEVITIHEVLSHSSSLAFEKASLFDSTDNRNLIILFIYSVFGVLLMLHAFTKTRMDVIYTGLGIIAGTVLGGFIMTSSLSAEGHEHFQAEKAKWEQELAIPYLESVPLKAVTNIERISPNRYLREKDKGLSKGDVPVTIETTTGVKYNLWVTVHETPKESEKPLLTYRYLTEDLKFHEMAGDSFVKGYYDITLYTNKPIPGAKNGG